MVYAIFMATLVLSVEDYLAALIFITQTNMLWKSCLFFFFFLPHKQVGKLQQRLIKPDTLELTDQCKEETGLSVDELCKADPLDTVLQQVNSISN